MHKHLRTAALEEEVEIRVRIAASLLAASSIHASVEPWDGTRCDLLIANARDAYGKQALDLALRRGTPVIVMSNDSAMHDGVTAVSTCIPAPNLARRFVDLLISRPSPNTGRKTEMAHGEPVLRAEVTAPIICRLAEGTILGHRVDIANSTRSITLCPTLGRAFASTHSDIHAAQAAIGENSWSIRFRDSAPSGDVSVSLDSFLMHAAYQAREKLPMIAQATYSLRHWPDLGSATDLVGGLRAAIALLTGPLDVDQLATRCQIDRTTANAYLWAFRASNLLLGGGNNQPEPTQPSTLVPSFKGGSSLFSRIAARFGLRPRNA